MSVFGRIGKLFKRSKRSADRELESFSSEEENQSDEEELTHHLTQIVDATYEMEDLKREYELVTSYFSDIQKIEQMPQDRQFALEDDSRKILMLEENRKTYQETPKRLPGDKYKILLRLEDEVPEAIKKLEELESMRGKIKRDLEYLEGEKGALMFQEEEMQEKQKTCKSIAIALGIIAVVSILAFMVVNLEFEVDLTAAGIAIAIIAMILEFFLVMSYNNAVAEEKLAFRKHNRAILLQNKVKIKWLNNINTLDYLYAKYEVNSCKELAYNWEQYLLMIEDEKKFKQNTGDLKVYQDEILMILSHAGVKDTNIWLNQVIAFVDKREMVEVKHSLNVRRQRLREQMKANESARQNSFVCVKGILTEHPELKGQARDVLTAYHIAV